MVDVDVALIREGLLSMVIGLPFQKSCFLAKTLDRLSLSVS